jgi:hypothetical protein
MRRALRRAPASQMSPPRATIPARVEKVDERGGSDKAICLSGGRRVVRHLLLVMLMLVAEIT